MNIYYKSIQSKKEDYLKVLDYIWRWDTDWFWCSYHFGVQKPFIRRLFGRKNLSSATYWKIRDLNHKIKILDWFSKKTESVVQDVEIPVDNAHKFLDFFFKNIEVRPIWVCPTMAFNPKVSFDLYPMDNSLLYINFGFWDVVPFKNEDGYYNKMIEKTVKKLSGKKSLYSTAYYSEDEFWSLYNKESYDKLKKKYDPSGRFKNLFDKVVKRV